MAAHAILSPSGASRWLACTPSARFEKQFPDRGSSAADEGTLAHALCELYLRNHLGYVSKVNYKRELTKIKASEFYNADMDGHAVDYVDFVTGKLADLAGPMIFIEERLDLTAYVPEGFGTGDCIIIADHMLEIIDLKYGKGVQVDAFENKQMMLYALGAVERLSLLYHLDKVRMTIYQPRLENYSSFEMPVSVLRSWGEDYLRPRAKMAFEGSGEYATGAHCRFCKGRTQCKALADSMMEVARHEFADPNRLTDEDMSGILAKASDIKTWLGDVQEYALAEALAGKKWPGFKLVAGRSVRKYGDPAAIQKAFEAAKIDGKLYLTAPALVGITALEKNIGKELVNQLAGPFIVKPEGSPTLAPDWDKRPELNSTDAAAAAFSEIPVDN